MHCIKVENFQLLAMHLCLNSLNGPQTLCSLAVVRLHAGDLRTVGWGEGQCTLVTPLKAMGVGVEF